MSASASTPTARSNRRASRSVSGPGPRPTSSRRPVPSRRELVAKRVGQLLRIGEAAARVVRRAPGVQRLVPAPQRSQPAAASAVAKRSCAMPGPVARDRAGRSGGSRRRSGRGRSRTARRRCSWCRSSRSPGPRAGSDTSRSARVPSTPATASDWRNASRELALGEAGLQKRDYGRRGQPVETATGQTRRRAGRRQAGSRQLRARHARRGRLQLSTHGLRRAPPSCFTSISAV